MVQHLNLSSKLSFLVIFGVFVSVGVLGFYFDGFLKETYLESTNKRMQHGFKRLSSDMTQVIKELKEGVSFVKSEEAILASIELINNYQDKEDYNAVLLDEEKKIIAQELLNKVKLSLNHEIALYDHNEELIAFVIERPEGYHLNFISYDKGRLLLYSKYEEDDCYEPNADHSYLKGYFKHQSYYSPDVADKGTVTYHLHAEHIAVRSHMSIFEERTEAILGHIEMSHLFTNAYFETLSNDLGLNISTSTGEGHAAYAHLLTEADMVKRLEIVQTETEYLAAAKLETRDGWFYYIVMLDKELLLKTLRQNRQQLLIIMSVVTLIVLLLLRFLFRKGLAAPLEHLMSQVSKIENYDYSPSELVRTGDELEMISRNVNQLSTTIQERERALTESQQELEYLSNHDSLTDLPNRRFFMLRLDHAIKQAKRHRNKLAVMFLDLDEFKHVNDTLGHDVGDRLLVEVSERLSRTVRASDTLARIGGDEFNILIEDIATVRDIEVVVEKILADFKIPFVCNDHEISTTASIGIALYPDDGTDTLTLIKHADLAMYQSKSEGRNNYSFFSSHLAEYIEERTTYINAMKASLNASCSEFHLLYQPKVSLHTGKISGMEALARWHSITLGFVRPDKFITMAEETNMIIPLGEWIMEQAFRDFMTLQREGCYLEKVSVNVSSVQLLNSDMVRTVKRAIQHTGIKPQQVELEITESYIASHEEKVLETLQEFRKMKVDLAIDDFGTGYSSMSYLQKLPVTRLKIDKSFVDELPGSDESIAIARAIIALAKTFNLAITAEGVEKENQLDFLGIAGCDEVQGYFYAKPLTLEAFEEYYQTFG